MTDRNKYHGAGSTMSTGAPAQSDRNSLTVGPDGPILLHDVHFLEQMAHFNREKVPSASRTPRVRARSASSRRRRTYRHIPGRRCFRRARRPRCWRGSPRSPAKQGSPDTWRDVRGFSLKFYTDEGNYDLVGNNTPIFFVRDPMKFPHFIRSQKRLPDSGLRDNHMQWDFWTNNPETAHQVTYLMGERGLPRTLAAHERLRLPHLSCGSMPPARNSG